LPLGHVVKPAIGVVAGLDMDLIVAKVSGVPSYVNLGRKLFARDIRGSIEAKVVMWSHCSRAFIDGKTGYALTTSYTGLTEKRSVQSIQKMSQCFAGFDCVDLRVGTVIRCRLLQCQGDAVWVSPGRAVNII
jgi:hypothetical protein